jgi:ATP-dependent Clp protease ATP-binding subunit ClpC
MKKTLMGECEKYFRPEFMNRLDEIIVFHPLVKDDLYKIIEIELAKVRERLGAKGIKLELEQSAKDFLIEKGYNPDFGARPLRRAIGTYVEDQLAEGLLSGEYKGGQKLTVSRKEGEDHLFFTSEPTDGAGPDAGDKATREPAKTAR